MLHKNKALNHKIALFVRKFPFVIRLPYILYRRLQPHFTIGVVGIIFDDQHRVLLVEHVLHPENPWGLPGGWIDRNEDPAIAVTRELQEELQLNAIVKNIVLVEKSHNNHLDIAYLCEPQNQVGNISNELLDYRWSNLSNLPPLKSFQYKAIQIAKNHWS